MFEGPTSQVIIFEAHVKGPNKMVIKRRFFLLIQSVVAFVFGTAQMLLQEFKKRKWSCGTNMNSKMYKLTIS